MHRSAADIFLQKQQKQQNSKSFGRDGPADKDVWIASGGRGAGEMALASFSDVISTARF
jgi:hypothetical protein